MQSPTMDIDKFAFPEAQGRAAGTSDLLRTSRAMRNPERVSHKAYRFGAHGARETPVPIPNTEVKPRSGYYTALVGK